MNPKLKLNINRILPFGIIWLILSWLFLWIEQAVILTIGEEKVPDSAISITAEIVLFASVSIFFIGCFVGFLEVVFINNFFISKSFKHKIVGKTTLYIVFIFIITFIFFPFAASIELNQPVFSNAVFNKYKAFFLSITFISTAIQLTFSILLSLLFAEIRDNIGQNVLKNFFTGKYHKPVKENRVFMFIDMKDSTTIAEELGHERYFEFLRSYYNDLSNAIIYSEGEVYQYIGDEVVVSWSMKKKNAEINAVNCFFNMKTNLKENKNTYEEMYNFYPYFKGAIHSGEVTIGEIGALKKEIFFTGDVLNTTSRIQALCNAFQSELLISEDIYAQLKGTKNFQFELKDKVTLKGKTKPVNLYAVSYAIL